VTQLPSFNLERLPENIEQAHKRLSRVQIESLPYEEILKRFDRPTTFFYLDPPYYGRKLYNYNFEPKDFATLAERLKILQGKFLLSLNDVPQVRALFGDFVIRDIDLHYTAQKLPGRRYKELIITNY
jgi:DNA adenine methylase